jgi:hypothetical protein
MQERLCWSDMSRMTFGLRWPDAAGGAARLTAAVPTVAAAPARKLLRSIFDSKVSVHASHTSQARCGLSAWKKSFPRKKFNF